MLLCIPVPAAHVNIGENEYVWALVDSHPRPQLDIGGTILDGMYLAHTTSMKEMVDFILQVIPPFEGTETGMEVEEGGDLMLQLMYNSYEYYIIEHY